MSFEELQQASVARRKKDVSIKLPDGRELVFQANELSFLERVALGISSNSGDDVHLNLIVKSITDPDGKHMTLEQAMALSNEHQEVFYRAALDVNSLEGKSKKKAD